MIEDCGELSLTEDDGFLMSSDDGFPAWPDDLAPDARVTTAARQLEVGEVLKTAGNTKFKEKDNAAAVSKYSKALRYLDVQVADADTADADTAAGLKKTRASCLLNRAQATIKLNEPAKWGTVRADCTAVLAIGGIDQSLQEKAYYRRSVAQPDDDDKKADLKAVLRLNPGNASAKRDLAAIKARYDQQVASQRKAMQKMFAS